MSAELIVFLWILGGVFFAGLWDKIREDNEDALLDFALTILLWPFAIVHSKGIQVRQQRLDRESKYNTNSPKPPAND